METEAHLYRYDRTTNVWNRFDGDSLAGVDPDGLALLLLGPANEPPPSWRDWKRMQQERDEARALVIRAVYPHERDSWGILMGDMEAQPWVQAAIHGEEAPDGGE